MPPPDIWLPRDAYLQERFCMPVAVRPGQTQLLEPGDLIFFGTPQRCTHVGLHLGGGRYLHSSGPGAWPQRPRHR
jgi:cell wall-associated NlpC family hydrolase